jgi:hypothetical protein
VGRVQPDVENPAGYETRIGRGKVDVAADQKPRADDQNDRERHLGHDQRAEEPLLAAPARAAAPSGGQQPPQLAAAQANRRRKSGQERGEEDRGEREQEDIPLDRHGPQPRQVSRPDPEQQPDRRDSEYDSQRAASGREEEALGQQLPDDSAAPRAQGFAKPDLVGPRVRPRKQQVRHVQTRDEQEEGRGPREQQDRRTNVADDFLEQGPENIGQRLSGLLVRAEFPGHADQIGGEALFGDARPQPQVGLEVDQVVEGRPDVDRRPAPRSLGKLKALPGHADHLTLAVVDRDHRPHDVGVGAEMIPPGRV